MWDKMRSFTQQVNLIESFIFCWATDIWLKHLARISLYILTALQTSDFFNLISWIVEGMDKMSEKNIIENWSRTQVGANKPTTF